MNNPILIPLVCLALLGCKSVYEKQGDEQLKAGDGLSALQRYRLVKEGKGSADFPRNLTHARILGMAATANALGDPEIILTYREKILAALPSLPGQDLKRLYIKTIAEASENFYPVPDPNFRHVCLIFKKDVDSMGAPEEIQKRMAWIAEEVARREKEALKKAGLLEY